MSLEDGGVDTCLRHDALSHRAIVELNARPCGRIVVRNSGLGHFSCLNSRVVSSYTLRVAIGQRCSFGGKAGKKNSTSGLDWRDCFTSFVGWKATPSGRYRLNFRSRLARSADLEGIVRANSITVLCVTAANDRSLLAHSDSIYYAVTVATLQVSEYLG